MSAGELPAINVGAVRGQPDPADPPGYRQRMARLGPLLGAEMLGATVYELDPGESICPYHYEFGNEEWLLVLEGEPTLRTPDAEQRVAEGDVVCFPEGPAGAHKLTNHGEALVRVLMLSTTLEPSVAIYPDSAKIGVWPPGKLFRERDAVEYYEDEPLA
ncbi:MAG: cupin domain-containing protein [Solirubrobacterales bacterium]|nr:cupin domain-containing protein [Solirubrobacterales bacterium]